MYWVPEDRMARACEQPSPTDWKQKRHPGWVALLFGFNGWDAYFSRFQWTRSPSVVVELETTGCL